MEWIILALALALALTSWLAVGAMLRRDARKDTKLALEASLPGRELTMVLPIWKRAVNGYKDLRLKSGFRGMAEALRDHYAEDPAGLERLLGELDPDAALVFNEVAPGVLPRPAE